MKDRKLSSRRSREVRLGKNGKPRRAKLTPKDYQIFEWLANHYPLARLTAIQAFFGGNLKSLQHHWELLSCQPNQFVYRHPEQWTFDDAYHRSTVYGLDKKGYEALWNRNIEAPFHYAPRNLNHELLWCEVIQSLELGSRHYQAEFISGQEIIANAPETTRNAQHPYAFDGFRGDGFPFGVGIRNEYRFFILEADTDTETIFSPTKSGTDLDTKLTNWIKVIQNQTYRTKFNIPNLYIMFITPNTIHMRNIISHAEKLTDKTRWLREFFLFQTYPTAKSFEKPPAPTGHMFTAQYQRPGKLQPFQFVV